MDCNTFAALLPGYLEGTLTDLEFHLMVEHEAACATCQELAMAAMPAPAEYSGGASGPDVRFADEAWLKTTLARTVGSDCRYIEYRLAETLDRLPDADIASLVEHHLGRCPDCCALAAVMQQLPDYYAAFPRLAADDAFVSEVAARTVGGPVARPGILDVLRTLVRRPIPVWEGAVVCALVLTPVAGDTVLEGIRSVGGRGQQVIEQVDGFTLAPDVKQDVASIGGQIAALPSVPAEAIENRWGEARTWLSDRLERATAISPTTSVPSALVRTWAQRALGRMGLLQTAPDASQPGTQDGTSEEESSPAKPRSEDLDGMEGDPHVLRQS